jgi:hypothetical protein
MPVTRSTAPATPSTSNQSFSDLYQGFRKRVKTAPTPREAAGVVIEHQPVKEDRSGLLLEQWKTSRVDKAREEYLRSIGR